MSKQESGISNRKSLLGEAESSQIEQATAEYDWETVRDLVNQALERYDLAPAEEFDLRKKLAKALDNLGEYDAAEEDIRKMIALARSMANDARLANALNMLAFNQILVDELDQATAAAEEARSLAMQLKSRGLEARALNMLGWASDEAGESESVEAYFRQALALARNGASPKDESWALRELSRVTSAKNDFQRAKEYNWQSVQVARASGDRFGELIALHYYAGLQDDLAKNHYYRRQAFELARVIDNRGMISIINNGLAWFYWRFGLAQRAVKHAKEAVRHQRKSRFLNAYLNSLDTLAFMARSAGDFDLARESYEELVESSREERRHLYYYGLDGLGRLALDEGNHVEAVSLLQDAVAGFREAGIVDAEASSKTWLAVASLAGDDAARALQLIQGALDLAQAEETFGIEHPRQEIWWQYYRILATTDGDKPAEERWHALEQARLALFEPVVNIGDEGLRRNYFNKPSSNCELSETWAREATRRDISLVPFTEREMTPAALAEQLQHIVESGARLASERDVSKLADFISQEFVELSGVERAIVGIRRPGELLQWASTFGFDAEEQQEVATLASPFIERTSKTLAPLLVDSFGEVLEGDVPELQLRSAIALPMISQGKLWGVLYGDMRHLFGRLNENDRDVLSLLANQAGAALENANWIETLELQVDDRTAELNARVSELALINSVQEGLVAELDLQAIFDIVGDKLTEIFAQGDVSLFTYDAVNDKALSRYFLDGGRRLSLPPLTPSPIWRYIEESKKPFLAKTPGDYPAWEEISGTTPTKSGMHVPLIAGDRFIGAVNVQSSEENAFDESDLRLLTTLANSMSVALENARLFNEAGIAREEAEVAREAAETSRLAAEEANEAKSAFMSNMSHELRTPLNAIIGFTRIVKRKTEDLIPQKQGDNLDKVLSSGEHLLGLINTVLDIAKIEAGRMDVINSRFHIGPLIEATANVAQPLLKPGAALHLDIADGLPELVSDQDKIKQILLNLLSNAAKFTHEGSITVSARQENDTLIISVNDTGIGMNEEALSRVFEEFQQADATTRKKYGGTGLGMPISKHLAQLLGGDLTVTSSEGEGSTFTLTLPIEAVNS